MKIYINITRAKIYFTLILKDIINLKNLLDQLEDYSFASSSKVIMKHSTFSVQF